MSQNQSQTIMGIMNQIDGVNLHEKKGGMFKFNLHMTQAMRNTALEALDLSPRPYNCLKRAGLDTVGDVVTRASLEYALHNIRNCGKTSVREILEHLFLFQYYSLPPEKRDDYLMEVVMLNKNR